ncbi:hypothetical protein ABZ351_31570 [Streptomyces microflavus]|uniref:hypothetical protein n=1 Tax=Streptomyces microflavus TaxID=1919 RepID=UPI0033D6C940
MTAGEAFEPLLPPGPERPPGPRPVYSTGCTRLRWQSSLVEELTFADADSILAMLRELCPHMVDGHLPDRDDIAEDPNRRADAWEARP